MKKQICLHLRVECSFGGHHLGMLSCGIPNTIYAICKDCKIPVRNAILKWYPDGKGPRATRHTDTANAKRLGLVFQ